MARRLCRGQPPTPQYNDHIDNLMVDARDYLGDAEADEFRGWLDRPVGETVAKLCAALELDPDSCALVGDDLARAPSATRFRIVPVAPRPRDRRVALRLGGKRWGGGRTRRGRALPP